jgi:hypothetical protein
MVVERAFPNPESALATDNERSNRARGFRAENGATITK